MPFIGEDQSAETDFYDATLCMDKNYFVNIKTGCQTTWRHAMSIFNEEWPCITTSSANQQKMEEINVSEDRRLCWSGWHGQRPRQEYSP
jgi:hypothetical protein